MRKLLVFSTMFLLVVGCGTTKPHSKRDFPDWYLNSPKDSKYLYSVGSGSVKEEFAPSKSELFMLAAQKLPKKLMRKISEHYSN